MKRILPTLIFLILSAGFLPAAAPEWVDSYGTVSPYAGSLHLSGFAMVKRNEPDSRAAAMDKALADLSKKIKIRVQSELVEREMESGGRYESSISSVTRSTVNTTVTGADFLFHEDRRNLYCLAYISIDSLKELYSEEASGCWQRIRNALAEAEKFAGNGKTDDALEVLYDSITAFPELYERWSLYKAVNPRPTDREFFAGMKDADDLDDIRQAETAYESFMNDIASRDAGTLTEGLEKIAVILAMQNVPGGNIQVPPLLFGSTSFSSEFGRYAGDRLDSALVDELIPGREKVVFRGQYWEEEEKIRLLVMAVNTEGGKLGKAEVLIPAGAAGRLDLEPQNFDQAMEALREFSDGAVSDGGINVDIWTNKGRDEDALTFTKGETLQLYFRVNQPAFLQITYRLATGELVLLEPSFYIGIDRVNRTVPLPYEFEVQPPFGVEQLIVTAYSVQPPTASTVPTTIEGELYDVFGSVEAVVVNTRGIGRKKSDTSEMRVGEAFLNMTMVPSE